MLDRYFWPRLDGEREIAGSQSDALNMLVKGINPKILQSVIDRLDGIVDGRLSVDYKDFKDDSMPAVPGPEGRRIAAAIEDDSESLAIELAALLSLAVPEKEETTFADELGTKADRALTRASSRPLTVARTDEKKSIKVSKSDLLQIIREELKLNKKTMLGEGLHDDWTGLGLKWSELGGRKTKTRKAVVAKLGLPSSAADGTGISNGKIQAAIKGKSARAIRDLISGSSSSTTDSSTTDTTTAARTDNKPSRPPMKSAPSGISVATSEQIDSDSKVTVTVNIAKDYKGVGRYKEDYPEGFNKGHVKGFSRGIANRVSKIARDSGLSGKMKNNEKLYFETYVTGGDGGVKWDVVSKGGAGTVGKDIATKIKGVFETILKNILAPGLDIYIRIHKVEATKTVARTESKNQLAWVEFSASSVKPRAMVKIIKKKGMGAVESEVMKALGSSISGMKPVKLKLTLITAAHPPSPNPHLHVSLQIKNELGWDNLEQSSKGISIVKNKLMPSLGKVLKGRIDIVGGSGFPSTIDGGLVSHSMVSLDDTPEWGQTGAGPYVKKKR
tara:strand:- start:17304 stop:18977 length:1674 start_codon:yes stop_codon:yes gene_type:complete